MNEGRLSEAHMISQRGLALSANSRFAGVPKWRPGISMRPAVSAIEHEVSKPEFTTYL